MIDRTRLPFFWPGFVLFLLLIAEEEKNKGTVELNQPSGRDSWTTATVQSTASAAAVSGSSNPTTSQSIDSFLTPSTGTSNVCTQQDYEILKASGTIKKKRKRKKEGAILCRRCRCCNRPSNPTFTQRLWYTPDRTICCFTVTPGCRPWRTGTATRGAKTIWSASCSVTTTSTTTDSSRPPSWPRCVSNANLYLSELKLISISLSFCRLLRMNICRSCPRSARWRTCWPSTTRITTAISTSTSSTRPSANSTVSHISFLATPSNDGRHAGQI